MASGQSQDKGPAAYGREAFAEWGKAIRYGARALAARRRERKEERPPLMERLNPASTEKGGKAGDIADKALSKMGTPGKLASKVSLGSRIVERVRPGHGSGANGSAADSSSDQSSEPADVEANGLAGAPAPVVGSIDVAVPIASAFDLATAFADYPDFLSRVSGVEEDDDSHLTLIVEAGRRSRQLDLELIDRRENTRLDWECGGDVEHSGVITFHRLAPRLTRIELTIELEPQGLLDRLARRIHLPERAIHEEMHRFKAYAELSDEAQDAEEEPADEDEEEAIEDAGTDEPGDEDFEDEELDDEEELEGEELEEDELDDEELDDQELEEEELEPAGSGR